MNCSSRTAHGPKHLPQTTQAFSATQAAWRFFSNESVTLNKLIAPLRQLGCDGCDKSESKFVLLAHDFCKLKYGNQTRRKLDLVQLTHEHDIGYELTTSLLIEANTGIELAPMQIQLKTASKVHSASAGELEVNAHRLDRLEPILDEASDWGLERRIVHVIDREADCLGRFRSWHAKGHLFLVRCDDRRVLHQGKPVLLSELNEQFDQDFKFQASGKAKYHGRTVNREVAEAEIILHRPHREVIDGESKTIQGEPIAVRAVFVRLVDSKDYILAEWMLLTNVPADEAEAAEIGTWYYFRWRIETFFKLLKSHGHELEYWQQKTGLGIAKRLLVAAMACVVVKQLEAAKTEAAMKFRNYLIRLSGRQMKYGVEHTSPALLAGYYVHLTMTHFLEENDITIDELKSLEKHSLKELQLV